MKGKAKIMVVDDDELIVAVLSKSLRKDGYQVFSETSTENITNKIKALNPDVAMLDIRMPGKSGIEILEELRSSEDESSIPVVMLTGDDTAETAVKAMKLGAADYVTKPFNPEEIKIIIEHIVDKENLKKEVRCLRREFSELIDIDMVGESPAIKELKDQMQKIAQAGVSTILVTGESGTGKELVARGIHKLMHAPGRSGYAPFISVNCAAMPESLLESELFGHEKGSFTDAKGEKKGLFELAAGGVMLLDEIGDMMVGLQSKLLRVLEARTIRRVGGHSEVPVDVTVIATTNRNLSEAVENGEFRKDLFFRLSAFYLHVLPLRKRKEDIVPLANYFLTGFSKRYGKKIVKGFSPEAQALLNICSWPGNIRELKNLVERLVVLESAEIIRPEHLPRWISESTITTHAHPTEPGRFVLPESGVSLDDLEKDLILQALDRANSNKSAAARLLNMSYDSFRYQLKKFEIS